ncbi:hypothetical protein TPHA_0M01270 [Tetrapisispora phaffii CBS 4417]|uniref:Uncharacterized protein n=1 Tax=Tetrapisispora phaffii (strain ATCC 24235 / CBS 4417 / NBRC 1672 / NRRL Y-8282 / UCD 70-5) TaxID=1071381 RepID=G8C0I7_TETPH|nr:hypothetical protein TPHA_0M01270 [Tetrapisispora phaffii CBS 4417]CCE65702.1 hypothetical protein TPHA_0M01270 [Tetrapisispora phaffii CBS 4417]
MLNSKNIKEVLESTLDSIAIPLISYESNKLQSSALVSGTTGSVLSFAMSNTDENGFGSSDAHSVNNVKVMSLLVKEKWVDDENTPSEQTTTSCYTYEIPKAATQGFGMDSDTTEPLITRVYIYELERLRACVAQLPKSDILLLFIASNEYPYGLLVKKMKASILSFRSLFEYKLE